MANENGWKIGFIVTLTILLVLLVAVIIFTIIAVVFIERLKTVALGAFYNTNECKVDPFKCNYINLEVSEPLVFENSFNNDLALLGSQLEMNLTFLKKNGDDLNLPSFLTFITYIQGCPTCDFPNGFKDTDITPLGYVALDQNTRTLYMTFRGAETSQDWQFAFNFNETYFKQNLFLFPPTLGNSSQVSCSSDTTVHSGFYALFNQLREEIIQIVLQNKDKIDRIVVYGHSLGAAIASLTGLYLTIQFSNLEIFVYTFGKPRVGNEAYSKCVERLLNKRFWRIENEEDIIVSLPLSTMPNFQNENLPYLYWQEGNRLIYQSNWGSQTLNHNINNYQTNIVRAINNSSFSQ